MKYLVMTLFFIAALYTNSALAIITAPYSNSFDATGTVKNRDRIVIRVRANSSTAIVKGQCVYYNTTSDDGITVDAVPTTSGRAYMPACMALEAMAVGIDGDCLVFGYTDALLFDAVTTAVAGEKVFCGSGTIGRFIAVASGSVGAYDRPVGQFLDASDASGSIEAFVNFL